MGRDECAEKEERGGGWGGNREGAEAEPPPHVSIQVSISCGLRSARVASAEN